MYLFQINFGAIHGQLNFTGTTGVTVGTTSVAGIIVALLPYIYAGAGFLVFLYLLSGGFQFLMSGGDQGKIKEGKSKITNAIVGLLLLLLSYWVVQLIAMVFGVTEITSIF